MSKKIIINVADHETRVALVEDETIVELFIDRWDDTDITGNIYKGRVETVRKKKKISIKKERLS